MDPMASPPVSDPTTPDRIFAHTRHTETPNKSTATFYPRSQPVGSTQRALQASLTNNIVFANEAIVHAIFQPSKVDDQTVVDILTKINDDNSLKAARRSALSGKVVEATKYKSILTLLDHITTYNHQDAPLVNRDYGRHVRRTWVSTHGQSIRTDPEIYLPGEAAAKGKDVDSADDENDDNDDDDDDDDDADDCRPDITLIDVPVDGDALAHPYGRHGCLYIEVKVAANMKPNPREAVTKKPAKVRKGTHQDAGGPPKVKSILRQIADIARLHLATRPFMRYSLHITVCGTIFNICLFDRAGAVVSKDYGLKDGGDFETFVRIIRRATCDMDAYELGLDPTVAPLDYLGSVARYPRFKVEVGDSSYHTYGLPIWQSVTLQGRGTWVFGATKEDIPNPKACERLVLKNAWRASGRIAESTLYGILDKLQEGGDMPTLRCVAEFVDGGDVMIEEHAQQDIPTTSSDIKEGIVNQRVAMRVSSHRRFVEDAESNPRNPTLHRVVLATRGKSMVSYSSLNELLSAAQCAAEGLHSLSLLGVDHRDVSIGNVLLGTDPEKAKGFISDLDLSSISEEAIKAAYPEDSNKIIEKLKDGEWRTGTAIFMSGALLDALMSMRRLCHQRTASTFDFKHRLWHDLESLIWVVVYAMMVHQRNHLAETDPDMFKQYNQDLGECWEGHAYSNVLRSHAYMVRAGCSPDSQLVSLWFPDPSKATFFRDAMLLIRDQEDGKRITYEGLCALFKSHINLAKEPRLLTSFSK